MLLVPEDSPTQPLMCRRVPQITVFQRNNGWSFHPFLCMTLLLLFITNTKGVLTWEKPVFI